MSKPRDRWWGYVRAVIRSYPELRANAKELQRTQTTPRYGASGGSGGPSDPVASAALRSLPPQEQREYEAVEQAIWETVSLPDGASRVRIIDLVFWRQSHTLEGAAQAVHLSYRTARRRQNEFIRLVAEKMGLIERLAPQSQKAAVE